MRLREGELTMRGWSNTRKQRIRPRSAGVLVVGVVAACIVGLLLPASALAARDHFSSTAACVSEGCHVANLVHVHSAYADELHVRVCNVCHRSTDPDVIAAIAADDKDCFACHSGNEHHADADVSALANGVHQCGVCHSASLVAEHAKSTSVSAARGCDACHAAGGPAEQLVGAWDGSCTAAPCHAADSPDAPHDYYCYACHHVSQPDFAVSKTQFPPVEDVNRDVVCAKCHKPGFVGTHPFHHVGANCGGSCHAGWGENLLTAVPAYVDPVSGASFATTVSKTTAPQQLHVIHSNPRWMGVVRTDDYACSSCHAAAACVACHTAAIPVEHAVHSATDQVANPAWTGLVAHGIEGDDPALDTSAVESIQCGSAGCHDRAASEAACPRVVEDYNYGVGGNPDDPTGTNSAITMSGVWRYRVSTLYTGAHMSYSSNPTQTLTATFTGARVEIVSEKGLYCGIGEVSVDGVVVGTFDAYAATSSYQVVVFGIDLEAGEHSVTVRPTGRRNPAARATNVVVDAFRVCPCFPRIYKPTCDSCHADRNAIHW